MNWKAFCVERQEEDYIALLDIVSLDLGCVVQQFDRGICSIAARDVDVVLAIHKIEDFRIVRRKNQARLISSFLKMFVIIRTSSLFIWFSSSSTMR